MTGYIRYRPINKTFLLMINSRILSKHIMSKGNNVKANICRDEGLFVVDLDKKGNIFGIELLEASKRIPLESLLEVNVKNILAVA